MRALPGCPGFLRLPGLPHRRLLEQSLCLVHEFLAQLVGGGPKPEAATFMEGHANGSRLQFTMRNLEGETLVQQEFAPLHAT